MAKWHTELRKQVCPSLGPTTYRYLCKLIIGVQAVCVHQQEFSTYNCHSIRLRAPQTQVPLIFAVRLFKNIYLRLLKYKLSFQPQEFRRRCASGHVQATNGLVAERAK